MKIVAALAVAAAAVALTASSSTAGAAPVAPHVLRGIVPRVTHEGNARRLATAVRSKKKTPGFNCLVSCSAYESTINQYFTDVAAASAATATDNVYSVPTQYSNIQYNDTFGGSTVDGGALPTKGTCKDGYDAYCVTDAQLQAEIAKVRAQKHWPKASLSALYFIFTPANVGVCDHAGQASGSNACTTNVFCAYHSSSSRGEFLYAVEPDAQAAYQGGCDTGQTPAGNAADDTINVISHEQIEAMTDPFGDGWIADDGPGNQPGSEIGDLCAYDFGSTALGGDPGAEWNQVINGHNYWLQLEYSNIDSGCVPFLGGTVTAADQRDGSGPLVFQGDVLDPHVMTTNTAYAIYWVPAPPANTALPSISGQAKVGKTLKASHGTWSNTPKFAYQWLRCSAAGKSCKNIAKAAGSSYMVTTADKGHRLAVRVTATNAVGSSSAIAAPTSKVTS